MNSNRVIIPRFGTTQVLTMESASIPDPGIGEIQVAVHYCGLNFADVIARRGYYEHAGKPPFTVGFEISGIVTKAGKNTDFIEGDRIVGVTRFGGYADVINIEGRRAFKLHKGDSMKEAAVLPAVYLTALHSLKTVAHYRAEEKIFIQAVAGGVGIAATQLCRNAGLEIFGAASSDEKLKFAKEHGLNHGINTSIEDFVEKIESIAGPKGIDIILDSRGGVDLKKSLGLLKRGGRAVTIGGAGILPPDGGFLRHPFSLFSTTKEYLSGMIHPLDLISNNISLGGAQLLLLWDQVEYLRELMLTILDDWRTGRLTPVVYKTYPLEKAGDAQSALESRATIGKLALTTRFTEPESSPK